MVMKHEVVLWDESLYRQGSGRTPDSDIGTSLVTLGIPVVTVREMI